MSSKWWLVLAASGVLAIGVAACGDDDDESDGGGGGEPSPARSASTGRARWRP